MYIYKVTNIINGKVYIGQSIRDIQQRFTRHINDALNNNLNTHFARAIRKYGKDSFTIEIIDTAETQDELNQKEQYWIHYYDSVNYGYNETDAIYKCGGNTYISKTKREMRKICKKISDSKIGALNPNSRKIKCLNIFTGEELTFDTLKDCQEYFGENTHRFITTRVTHQTKSLYLSEWNIAYFDEPYSDLKEHVDKRGTEIIVTNLFTKERTKYASIRLLCRELNLSRETFNRNVKNENGHFVIGNYKFDIID